MSVAWVLNLGAEVELAGGVPTRALSNRADLWRRTMRFPDGHVVIDVDDESSGYGLEGRCWCPTPSALDRLRVSGASIPRAPPLEVIRRVNERGFAQSLLALHGSVRCTDVESVRATVARGGRWLMIRGLSFAGRGQRRVDRGELGQPDEAWLSSALTTGAVYVLPRVEIELEVSLHGFLNETIEMGEVTVSEVDRHGQWRSSRLESGELDDDERRALRDTFERVADALRRAGYFGPFGLDAFRHGDGFHPLSEINTRYSMGWPVGMGGWR